ncbi:hypothetical protein [Paenibacillus eucommiae]|uniref:Uncharacterized protein n=1 Tax=Paenibacillus eucommiae TaxID=1355755 RepID=A0ABS4ITP1_9BACL|nr:hypothetical protein [Paenibacillus eucommiae]MBP1990939.1 hypothetical protein [Paenibacillus eucommiae]
MNTATDYEKWIWIELIGFDHLADDYGVEAYLERAGFIPDGLSLLLFTPDFIHAHPGMEQESLLPVEACSYAGRPYGKHRHRQAWTNYQLRGLIRELQRHGVEVYCSFFNLFLYRDDQGNEQASTWCAAHPELYEMRNTGEAFPVLNPLKRFKDGSYYEDLLISDLSKVMRDYNFDGFHGADGYTSPRLSLAEADYSDDMIGQFLHISGVELPGEIKSVCDGDPLEMKKRGDWIWKHEHMAWIRFYARRWGELWQKIMPALRQIGKKAVLNSVWTRDPFEALYRYGVDYQLLIAAGVDGIVVESGAAALSAGADGMEYEPGTEFMAMLMAVQAHVPNIKLICLNGIQDTTEQWDAISHAPTLVERDVYTFSNLYIQQREGPRRCASGFMACLGDGISRDGWEWLVNRWDLGFNGQAERVIGASYVWSDEQLYRSLAAYPAERHWPAHKFVKEMLDRGAPLHAMVNVHGLEHHSGAICITGLELLPDTELRKVLAYRNGPAVLLGTMTAPLAHELAKAGVQVECEDNRMFAIVRETGGTVVEAVAMEQGADVAAGDRAAHHAGINDALSWIKPLYYSTLSESFLQACVRLLRDISGAPRPLKNEAYIRSIALEMEPGRWRLLLQNLHMNYKSAQLDLGRPIRSIQVLTDFPGIPIFPKGPEFSLYVPGRGMVIVEVDFQV